MKFSHLVIINDPQDPLIEPLTAEQVWHGLVLRAEKPGMFISWLDSCIVTERSDESIQRELRFGDVLIHDRVTFHPPTLVEYHVPAQNDIPVSHLSMRIESPQEGVLVVRFEYEDDTSNKEGTEAAFYDDFRRSAYQEADIDTVRMIRELAAQGRLDASEQ